MRDPHEPHSSSPSELQALADHQRAGEPFIAWRDDEQRLRFLTLALSRPTLVVGRRSPADVVLGWDPKVSAEHAELSTVGAGWFVEDLASTNGTYLDGKRIWGRARLRDQSRVTVGSTVIAFHERAAVGPEQGEPSQTEIAAAPVARDALRGNELAVLRELCRPLILDGEAEPPTNGAIGEAVFLEENTVRKILTTLYRRFDVVEEPKRRRLAQRAIATGIVTLRDCVP